MWTVWIIAAALFYVAALVFTLALVAGAARGGKSWDRRAHDALERMHREHDFHRAA